MPSTSALEYQDNVNVQFTFNPTLSLSVSGNLVIEGLTPGSSKDSNIVNVNVSSNNVAGYSLTATTGTKSTSTDLIHDSASNYKFTNLSSNIASLSSFSDNTWGYSYSNDNGTTWISGNVGNPLVGYNGLPKDNNDNIGERGKGGITLINTNSPADTSSIQFKIGAKASTAQLAGTYTNTVNFYAVTKMPPISLSDAFAANGKTKTSSGYYKMQDMNPTICAMTEVLDEDSQTQLIDIRDNKLYWVAKLQDDHCWMTQNLDLNLDSSVALTSNDTNLVQYNTGGYVDGYSCSNSDPNCAGGVISWMPERSTIDAVTDESTSIASISGWVNDANNPYSADAGNWYWKGEYYASDNCPSNSNNNYLGCNYISKPDNNNWATYFSTIPYSSVNSTHGHVGNYYNWASSIASNNASAYTTNTTSDTASNPKNSICPAGWRLPVITNYTSSSPYAAGDNEFYNLAYYYGVPGRGSDQKIIGAPLYFTRAGIVWSALHDAGYNGGYWSSTVASGTMTYSLYFISGWADPQHEHNRLNGRSVRCLADIPETVTINDLEYLQDFATLSVADKASVKESMTTNEQYQLKDSRDKKQYWISKLADGHIWMTQNLDLDFNDAGGNIRVFTSNDTDLNQFGSNNYDTNNGYNCSNPNTTTSCTAPGEIISWVPERRTINAATTEETSIYSIDEYIDSDNDPYSVDTGDWYLNGDNVFTPCFLDSVSQGCNYVSKPSSTYESHFSTTPYPANGAHGHVGNHYNWSASIATNNGSSFIGDTSTNPADNPKNSVCPAGWRLPIIVVDYAIGEYGDNDFYNLALAYNNGYTYTSVGIVNPPLYFTITGYIYNHLLRSAGNHGYYWSSAMRNQQAYGMWFYNNNIDVTHANNRKDARSVRCLLR